MPHGTAQVPARTRIAHTHTTRRRSQDGPTRRTALASRADDTSGSAAKRIVSAPSEDVSVSTRPITMRLAVATVAGFLVFSGFGVVALGTITAADRSPPESVALSRTGGGAGNARHLTEIPSAFLSFGDDARQRGQQGTLIAYQWPNREGVLVTSSPGSSEVEWPESLAVQSNAPFRIRFGPFEPPMLVELRFFRGGVGTSGVPVEGPEYLACLETPDRKAAPCTWSQQDDATTQVFARLPGYDEPMAMILMAQWHPRPARTPGGPPMPPPTVSWGFLVDPA